jgi:hypothetical protein
MFRREIVVFVAAVLCASAGCGSVERAPTAPSSPAGLSTVASQSSERCANVALEGTAGLGIFDGALGAAPEPATIAGVSGTLRSVITGIAPSGRSTQGAQHITLRHNFESASGSFRTDDQAVCGPAGADPNVCRVNDVMAIVSGTGIFANASGQLVNHGVIDLNSFTLSYAVRGRVCGDGL